MYCPFAVRLPRKRMLIIVSSLARLCVLFGLFSSFLVLLLINVFGVVL